MSAMTWIFSNKLLIFMIAATTAFGISTIILAVEKAELRTSLNSCRNSSATTEKPTETTCKGDSTTEPPTSPVTDSTVSSSNGTDLTSSTSTTISTTPEEIISSTTTENPTETTCKGDSTTESPTTPVMESTLSSSTGMDLTSSLSTEMDLTSTTALSQEDITDFRLPKHVVPESYDLELRPNLDDGVFTGRVNIKVIFHEETTNIKLHSNKLAITSVTVDDNSVKYELIPKYELLVIDLKNAEMITKGTHSIAIVYSGNMTDRIVGLYKSTYINEDGDKRNIATSKLEPTYARQAFPCFDEPDFKATYTVHILKPKDDATYIALSNMPVEDETARDDEVFVNFKESVRMSTYLTCFILCDFKFSPKEVRTQKGPIDLKVYATPAQLHKTEFARDIAEKILQYFVKYFNYEYPLPKLDLIAIPDFAAGAMENWGLMTFREIALLYDKIVSSTINKQQVATVVSHELAHSWFGNLVTMSWWNDLWLNEGFASYIQYKGVDAVEENWQMMDQFLIETLHPVLSIDALSSSHPIIKTVVTPDEIAEIFDGVIYSKGASILRMLEQAIGEDIFQTAVQKYLAKYKFGNAVTQDLLDQLQPLLKDQLNVTEFLDTWTKQVGYPILTVTENNPNYMILTQKRFLKNSAEENNDNYSWTIPVTFISSVETEEPQLYWFNSTENSLKITKPKKANWIKFNHKQIGYYRVNYPIKQWENLSKPKTIKKLGVADRSHLLEESFSIAESGELSYKIPLDMTKYLKTEDEYIPWCVASNKLIQLNKYLSSSCYFDYLDYIIEIARPIYRKVTWNENKDGEEHLTNLKRIRILELMCYVEHEDCLKKASARLDEWFVNNKTPKVTQDLRSIIFKYGMVYANRKKWEKMLDRFEREVDANERINMMMGLAAVKNPELLKRLIELGETEKVIRGQDYFSMLQYISENSVGTAIVWDYVRENWENLVMRFSLNDGHFGKLIPAITASFTTTMRLEEMRAFFEKYPEAGAGKAAREQALATVQANINWISKNKEEVEKWIKNLSF